MKLEDVTSDGVDEISFIKIDRRKPSDEKIFRIGFSDTIKTEDNCLTRVLEHLYR